jgi:hypothetical protein
MMKKREREIVHVGAEMFFILSLVGGWRDVKGEK